MVKLRILIIDNEPRWINFAKHNLTSFEVVAVANAKKALTELKKKQFDLVIASSRQLNALETIREKYAKKPMIVTTVDPTSQEARTAYQLGARRYFTKSFNHKDLLEQIEGVIPNLS
jgi:DNA-binding NtrC family response regulator